MIVKIEHWGMVHEEASDMIPARTVMSVIRTAIYGSVAGIFALSDANAIMLVDAVVIGVVLADYLTWVIWSLIKLPSNLWHGCYDGVVNLLFGWFLFQFAKIELPTDGDSIATIFATFMVVILIKAVIYTAAFIDETYE